MLTKKSLHASGAVAAAPAMLPLQRVQGSAAIWRVSVGLTAAMVAALTLGWRFVTFVGFQNDHFVHLARAQQLLLGDWPIRDFVDPGLPLMYGVSAAAGYISGISFGTELVLVSCAFALGALFTFLVAVRVGGSIGVAAGVALAEVLIAPRTYSYPKVLLYSAAAWAVLRVIESPAPRRLLLVGALIGTAFLFRHDHGVYIGLTALTAVALDARRLGWRVATRRLATAVGGAAVVALPWLGFVEYHLGVIDYFRGGVEYSRAEARNTMLRSVPQFTLSLDEGLVRVRPPYQPTANIRWTPATSEATRRELEARYRLEPVPAVDASDWVYRAHDPSPATMRALADDPHVAGSSGLGRVVEWSSFDALLARVSPLRLEAGAGLRAAENSWVWLFYLFQLLPPVCAALVWRRRATGRERFAGEAEAVTALAVMAVLVNVGLMRGNLPVWLPDAIVPSALLGAWVLPLAWNAGWRHRTLRAAARVAIIAVLLATTTAIGHAGDVAAQIERSHVRLGVDGVIARADALAASLWQRPRHAGFAPSGVSVALLPFFEYLDRCTVRDDRFVMTWLFPDVFVMAERGFAAGHEAFMPGYFSSPADQERALDRLGRQSVPFVLIFRDREEAFRRGFRLLSAHFDRDYEQIAEVPVEETSAIRVLVQKDRPVVRVDPDTTWPCFR